MEAGHRAIMFSRLGGIQKDIMTEGLHFRIPWFQYPIIYDIRSKPRKLSSPTGSKDLQMVNISLRVLSRPDASTLPSMYRQLGLDYDEKVLRMIIHKNFDHSKYKMKHKFSKHSNLDNFQILHNITFPRIQFYIFSNFLNIIKN